jgi:hypothetical protein
MLIYLNAALVSWQTVNRRFPDAGRLGLLVAAFMGRSDLGVGPQAQSAL